MSLSHERSSLLASSSTTPDGASAFFDAPTADDERSRARNFARWSAWGIAASAFVSLALSVDMLGHSHAIHAHTPTAALGGAYMPSRWVSRRAPKKLWSHNVPVEAIDTPELAFAELERIELTGEALAVAQHGLELQSATFGADRFLDANMMRRKLETPVYVIAVQASVEDMQKANNLKHVINEAYRIDTTATAVDAQATDGVSAEMGAPAPLVQIQSAINAQAWPNTIDLANDAAAPLEAEIPLKALYYLNALAQARKNDNKLPKGWMGVSHHVGCLYSHLRMWQLHARAKSAWTIIFESDGLYFLAVAPWQLQSVVDNAPSNADVIFLHKKDLHSGQFVRQWRTGNEMLYMYNWDKVVGGAGLSAYMIGPRFTEKINKEIIGWRGADMVDAWLMLKMCDKKDNGDYNDAHRLNCYHAQRNAKPKHNIGGYLPEWYGVDKSTRWTDNWAQYVANEQRDVLYRDALNARKSEYNVEQAEIKEQKRAARAATRAARARMGAHENIPAGSKTATAKPAST